VIITHKGAESPGSGRIGAIGALVYFLPSEAVGALEYEFAARPLYRTIFTRISIGECNKYPLGSTIVQKKTLPNQGGQTLLSLAGPVAHWKTEK